MFGRWKNRKVVSEATNYIKAADQVSRPMAILLALIGIIVIAGLIFLLFLGGRWVYNKFQDDEPASINTEQSETTGENRTQPDNNGGATVTPTPPSPTPTQPSTPQTAPSTQTPQNIPNTGPSEE